MNDALLSTVQTWPCGTVFVRGTRAYLSAEQWDAPYDSSNTRLHMLDFTDPDHPVDHAAGATRGWGWLLGVEGDLAVVGITDAVKWSGWANDLDPLAPVGDDTIIVALRDRMLGQNPGVPTAQHDPSESTLDGSAPAGKNDVGTDGDQDI